MFVVEGRNSGGILKGRSSESGRTDLTDGDEGGGILMKSQYGRLEALIGVSMLHLDRIVSSRSSLEPATPACWSCSSSSSLCASFASKKKKPQL